MMNIETLLFFLQHLDWTSVTILYDVSADQVIRDISLLRRSYFTKWYLVDATALTNNVIHHHLRTAYEANRQRQPLFVVSCSPLLTEKILQQAEVYDRIEGRGSAFAIFSRWFLILKPNTLLNETSVTYGLDHLAAVSSKEDNQQVLTKNDERGCYLFTQTLHTQFRKHWTEVTIPYGDNIQSSLFPNLKYKLNNRTLLATLLPWPPFVYKRDVAGIVEYSGYSVDLLNILASSLNFSYEFIEPEDGEWGVQLGNNWTGMVGMLQHQEADIVAAPLIPTNERERVMDFLTPFFYDHNTVVYKNSAEDRQNVSAVLTSFHVHVFLCLVGAFIWINVILAIGERKIPSCRITGTTGQKSPTNDTLLSLTDGVCGTFASLVLQGGQKTPFSKTGRVIVSAWLVFAVIITAAYKGNLISFLLVAKTPLPFRSLSEMVQQNEIRWGTVGGTFWQDLLEFSNETDFQLAWAGIRQFQQDDPDILHSDINKHLTKVLSGGYAFIGDRSIMQTWQSEHCGLHVMQEHFTPTTFSFGLVNNSDLLGMFNEKMSQIVESGFLDILYRWWSPRPKNCGTSRTITEAQSLNLNQLLGVFYVLAFGIGVSICVLLAEAVVKYGMKDVLFLYCLFSGKRNMHF